MNPADPAEVELDQLIALFFDDASALGQFEEVGSDDLPNPEQAILSHDHHMTVTVEHHHGTPVNVKVLEVRSEGDTYSRKILLTRLSDEVVVQYGIVRLNLGVLEDQVRKEIESQSIPLGRVLINHNVLREVKLLSLFKIVTGQALADAFGCDVGETIYGRTAMIYCNGSPAVELLEIVGNV